MTAESYGGRTARFRGVSDEITDFNCCNPPFSAYGQNMSSELHGMRRWSLDLRNFRKLQLPAMFGNLS
jgi:hypothetical protein